MFEPLPGKRREGQPLSSDESNEDDKIGDINIKRIDSADWYFFLIELFSFQHKQNLYDQIYNQDTV